MASPPPKFRKRRRPRVGQWIARFFALLFALLGLLPVVAGALLRTEYARERASEESHRLLLAELGIDASFRPSVRPWPLTVILDDVQVASSDGTAPAVTVERLTLRPQIFSLIQGRLNAGEIEVERPRVRLVFRDGKLVNL
ncbi:MAG: hypothetical protein U1E22_03625, partial [Coriobacteriia bacterium]|nr:hypothetical protein [Coriobacteriia bacterium]